MCWAQLEMAGLDLGDKRLHDRVVLILNRWSQKPMASIPEASHGWGETMGTYRFLSNESVSWDKLLEPHWTQTEVRLKEHEVVLCIQDTTELDFNGQEIAGLGPLSYESQRGMYLHATYMVTTDREPLGVWDAWMWSRETKPANDRRPGIVESTRWIEGYERLAERAEDFPHTRFVYVADREADILALLVKAHDLGEPVDYLIRACHDRSLETGEKLWASVQVTSPIGNLSFTLRGRKGEPVRRVQQDLYVKCVTLSDKRGGYIETTCLIAKERHASKGNPITWRLLTNRLVNTDEEAVELLQWYCARWEIEIFFDILKNACQIEALQLSHRDRIERALALFMVVSWRIARLMRLGRDCPDINAELLFEPVEWKMAFILLKKAIPDKPPTLNTVIRAIARLGGFLGRKSDGEPGVKTLWKGMQCLAQSVIALQHLQEAGLAQICV